MAGPVLTLRALHRLAYFNKYGPKSILLPGVICPDYAHVQMIWGGILFMRETLLIGRIFVFITKDFI